MIKKEQLTWMTIGGQIRGEDLVADLISVLKKAKTYQSLPPDEDMRKLVLYQTALNIIAKDKATLIHTLHLAKEAISDEDFAKAKIIIDKTFNI